VVNVRATAAREAGDLVVVAGSGSFNDHAVA
jgi:hypothetical protein